MNKKPTKEILTKQKLAQEMSYRIKAVYPVAGVVCFLTFIIMIIFLPICLDALDGTAWGVVRTISGFFLMACVLIVSVLYVYTIVTRNLNIRKGKFVVVKDILSRKVKGEEHRYGRRRHYDDVFYFYKHGRYVVTAMDGSAFEYSDENDEFYLVFDSEKCKGAPVLVYNAKIYEYNEK